MATPIEQLQAMRGLAENWDGYGAASPLPDVIDGAIRFLRDWSIARALPEPFVTPTRAGGVLLAWQQGPHQLEVEFDTSEKASFVYLNQETGETATGSVVLRRPGGQSPFALTAIMSAIPAAPAP